MLGRKARRREGVGSAARRKGAGPKVAGEGSGGTEGRAEPAERGLQSTGGGGGAEGYIYSSGQQQAGPGWWDGLAAARREGPVGKPWSNADVSPGSRGHPWQQQTECKCVRGAARGQTHCRQSLGARGRGDGCGRWRGSADGRDEAAEALWQRERAARRRQLRGPIVEFWSRLGQHCAGAQERVASVVIAVIVVVIIAVTTVTADTSSRTAELAYDNRRPAFRASGRGGAGAGGVGGPARLKHCVRVGRCCKPARDRPPFNTRGGAKPRSSAAPAAGGLRGIVGCSGQHTWPEPSHPTGNEARAGRCQGRYCNDVPGTMHPRRVRMGEKRPRRSQV